MAENGDGLRTIVRRLLDGWVIGDNCDPGEAQELAWERCRIAAPGSFVDEREPFEPGIFDLLASFDAVASTIDGEEGVSQEPLTPREGGTRQAVTDRSNLGSPSSPPSNAIPPAAGTPGAGGSS